MALVTNEDVVAVLEIMEAIEKSLMTGEMVRF